MELNHRNDLASLVMTCMIEAVVVSSTIRPSEQLKNIIQIQRVSIKCMYLYALEIKHILHDECYAF